MNYIYICESMVFKTLTIASIDRKPHAMQSSEEEAFCLGMTQPCLVTVACATTSTTERTADADMALMTVGKYGV